MPKKRGDNRLLKKDYVAALVDILRVANANDYEKVSAVLQAEKSATVAGKKGFSK